MSARSSRHRGVLIFALLRVVCATTPPYHTPDFGFFLWDGVQTCVEPTPQECLALVDLCATQDNTWGGYYAGGDVTSAQCQLITGGFDPTIPKATSWAGINAEWTDGIPPTPYNPLNYDYIFEIGNGIPCHGEAGSFYAPDADGVSREWCTRNSYNIYTTATGWS